MRNDETWKVVQAIQKAREREKITCVIRCCKVLSDRTSVVFIDVDNRVEVRIALVAAADTECVSEYCVDRWSWDASLQSQRCHSTRAVGCRIRDELS